MAKPINLLSPIWSVKNLILFCSILGLLTGGITIIYVLKFVPSFEDQSQPINSPISPITTVTALGRIEPQGQVTQVAPSPDLGGAKIAQLLVKEGEQVEAGQILAILDTLERKQATVKVAQESVNVAQANLEIIKAGTKEGEIIAKEAQINRLKQELTHESQLYQTKLAKLKTQLLGEEKTQSATLTRLTSEFQNAEKEYHRHEMLAQEGAISTSDLERHRLILDQARERLRESQATYQKTIDLLTDEMRVLQVQTNKIQDSLLNQIEEENAKLQSLTEIRPVDVHKAQTELQRAIAELDKAKAELETAYIKAPSQGRILNLYTKVGEKVTGDGILALGNTEKMIVVAEVYESDIKQIKMGQKATIKSENQAFDSVLTGQVSEIGWQIGNKRLLSINPSADIDVRIVEIKIVLDNESSHLVSNLTNAKVISMIEVD
jgi:HlyD family secretion protein